MKIRLKVAVAGVAEVGDVVEVPDDNRGYGVLSRHVGTQLPPHTPVTVELTAEQVETLARST